MHVQVKQKVGILGAGWLRAARTTHKTNGTLFQVTGNEQRFAWSFVTLLTSNKSRRYSPFIELRQLNAQKAFQRASQ